MQRWPLHHVPLVRSTYVSQANSPGEIDLHGNPRRWLGKTDPKIIIRAQKGERLESCPAKGGTGRTIEPGWVPCRFEQTNLKQGGQPGSDKVKSTGIWKLSSGPYPILYTCMVNCLFFTLPNCHHHRTLFSITASRMHFEWAPVGAAVMCSWLGLASTTSWEWFRLSFWSICKNYPRDTESPKQIQWVNELKNNRKNMLCANCHLNQLVLLAIWFANNRQNRFRELESNFISMVQILHPSPPERGDQLSLRLDQRHTEAASSCFQRGFQPCRATTCTTWNMFVFNGSQRYW